MIDRSNLREVDQILKRLSFKYSNGVKGIIDWEDLYQEGWVIILKNTEKWKKNGKGMSFRNYILNGVKRKLWKVIEKEKEYSGIFCRLESEDGKNLIENIAEPQNGNGKKDWFNRDEILDMIWPISKVEPKPYDGLTKQRYFRKLAKLKRIKRKEVLLSNGGRKGRRKKK